MHQERVYLNLKKETGGCVAAARLFSRRNHLDQFQADGDEGDPLVSSWNDENGWILMIESGFIRLDQ
jgi:hypothetical protein